MHRALCCMPCPWMPIIVTHGWCSLCHKSDQSICCYQRGRKRKPAYDGANEEQALGLEDESEGDLSAGSEAEDLAPDTDEDLDGGLDAIIEAADLEAAEAGDVEAPLKFTSRATQQRPLGKHQSSL